MNSQDTRFRWVTDARGIRWLVTEVPRYHSSTEEGSDPPARADGFVLIFRDPTDRLFGVGVDTSMLGKASDEDLLDLLHDSGAK